MSDLVTEYLVRLKKATLQHEKWREHNTLNLIASENFASPYTRSFLSSDLSNRYSARDRFYRGTKYLDEIEAEAVEIAKSLYHAKYADVRPISGHTCSLIVFMALLKPGNKIVTCDPKHGGYPGSSALGLGPLLSLKNLYFPYNPKAMNIISAATRHLLEMEKPEMIVFGSSFIPFPYQIQSAVPRNYAGFKIYDGSHVMGLIAGRKFQSPLEEGCSILMGSSHKSLFGPQGGLILSNDEEIFSQVESKVHPGIVDNIHWNRVAALAYSMLELLKFGGKYASQVVRNSKCLAKTLANLGVPVKCTDLGYTESHQVLLGYEGRRSKEVARVLESFDIITDVGIRLGTSEVTRRGMKENEMEQIAYLIHDALRGKRKNDTKARVHKLVRAFNGVEFTFTK